MNKVLASWKLTIILLLLIVVFHILIGFRRQFYGYYYDDYKSTRHVSINSNTINIPEGFRIIDIDYNETSDSTHAVIIKDFDGDREDVLILVKAIYIDKEQLYLFLNSVDQNEFNQRQIEALQYVDIAGDSVLVSDIDRIAKKYNLEPNYRNFLRFAFIDKNISVEFASSKKDYEICYDLINKLIYDNTDDFYWRELE